MLPNVPYAGGEETEAAHCGFAADQGCAMVKLISRTLKQVAVLRGDFHRALAGTIQIMGPRVVQVV
jgi:hypothetical protein